MNGDGRPDLFVAGYTNMAGQIPGSIAGFPTNYEGVRDLLFLNEGSGPNGRTRFKEVGVEAGLESSHFRHGLGAIFTDVNGDGRPDLYVANDEDPNDLYINEPGGPLGFHFVDEAKAYGVDDHERRDGRRRGRLQRRRPPRPLRHELARPAARRLREHDPAKTARPATGNVIGDVREGARPQGDRRLGRLVRRLRRTPATST